MKNGEISVILGQKWRKMSRSSKIPFEEKASILLTLHNEAKKAHPEAFK